MHRTDGNGYVEVGGERRFADRNLPTYAGTIVEEQSMNAIQEEICNVIEYAGLTLRSSGATDESAGWTQLRDAIFSSAAIGTDAVSAISLSKISNGTLDIDSASYDNNLTMDISAPTPYIQVSDGNGADTGDNRTRMEDGGFEVYRGGGSVGSWVRKAEYNLDDFSVSGDIDYGTNEIWGDANQIGDLELGIKRIRNDGTGYDCTSYVKASVTQGSTDNPELKVSKTDNGGDESYARLLATTSGAKLSCYDQGQGLYSQVSERGVIFGGTSDPSDTKDVDFRKCAIDLSGSVTFYGTVGSSLRLGLSSITTELSASATVIYNASIRYLDTNDQYSTLPASCRGMYESGGDWVIQTIDLPSTTNTVDIKESGGFASDLVLWLEYYFV